MSDQIYGPRRIEDPSDPNDDSVARLLRAAGGRPPIPTSDAEIIRAAARAEWQSTVSVERWKKRTYYGGGLLAAAAALVLVVNPSFIQSFRTDTPQVAATPIATVEATQGQVTIQRKGNEDPRSALATRDTLAAGDIVETTGANGRAVFRLADGASVRFDVETRARMSSSTVLTLERGALYIDSDSVGPALTIETAFGVATDIGTRFEVRLAEGESTMRVRVRDGEVELERDGKLHRAMAGEELSVLMDGSVQHQEVPSCGPLWDWTFEILPKIEHKSAHGFLEWAAEESCSELIIDSAVPQSLIEATISSATMTGLSLEDALVTMALGSGGLAIELDREDRVLKASMAKDG